VTDTALIGWAAEELLRVIRPLRDALDDEDAFVEFLKGLGWDLAATSFDIDDVRSAVGIADDLETVQEQLPALADAGEDPTPALAILLALASALASARELANATPPQGLAQAWSSIAADLPAELVGRYLESYHPASYAALLLTGIVEERSVEPPQGATGRISYVKRELAWSRFSQLVDDPAQVLRDTFGWGTSTGLDPAEVSERLARALRLLGVPAASVTPPAALLNLYYSSGHPQRSSARAVELTLVDTWEFETGAAMEARLMVLPVPDPANAGGVPSGVVLVPAIAAAGGGPAAWPFSVSFKGALGLDGGVRLELVPGSRTAIPADGSTAIDAGVAIGRPVTSTHTLLGDPSSTSLKARGEHIGLWVTGAASAPEVAITVGCEEVRFVLDPGQADGFLGRFLGAERQELVLSVAVTWSSQTGVSFEGGAALKLCIPLNLTLGVVEIGVLTIRVAGDQDGLTVTVGAGGRLTLGPVVATVENVGIEARAAAASASVPPAPLGDVAVAFGFKPPDGLGLAVEAGPVRGGGFVLFDPQEEQYAGALQLDLKALQLTAVGLLTTRMPDGSKGFSFLVIVSAQFSPIQLGFGFTLLGVGGLVGINRGVNVEFLRAGLKDGTLDSVRFPKDVAANAPRIISDLRTAFPVAEDQYVFGPMVALGWGTPPILRLELGLVLELPSPLRLLLLGELTLTLPEETAPAVLIKLDVLGVIDFDRGEASMDGALRDSRVLTFPLTGEMAMRASFGAQPTFALSAGGFNPRFQPPPAFPALQRMAIALSSEDNPRLRLEAYLAVTSNTLQLGAHLDLFAEKDLGALGDFTLAGHLGFDGLLRFDPFGLVVDLGALLTLKRNGANFAAVSLTMTLTGPEPWHAWGDARFEVLGIEKRISFDLTVGEPAPPRPLEPVDPLEQLKKALGRRDSWSAQAPELGQRPIVTLRPLDPAGTDVVVHPLGRLTVWQRVLPLDLGLQRFGQLPLASGARSTYTIKSAAVGGKPASQLDEVRDHFAPGDFLELNDEEKLARPAFERLKAGVSLDAPMLAAGARARANIGYRELIVDDPEKPPTEQTDLHHLSPAALSALAHSGPAGRAPVRERYPSSRPNIEVGDAAYALASRETMLRAPGTTVYGTFSEAEAERRARKDAEVLQVVGAQEVGV